MDPRTRNQTRRHRRHGLRPREGFTLVELLAIIGIIGLLLGLLTLTVTSVRIRTRVQKSQFIISQLAGAIRVFHNERGEYPPSYQEDPDYFGSEWLVQALTGYQDEAGDWKTGWGFRDMARGKVFGPYNDAERLQRARVPGGATVRYEFVDAFDRAILYYRYDSEDGYVALHNDEARDDPPDPPSPLSAYLWGPGNDYIRKDFVLISPGPDGEYLDDHRPYHDGEWDKQCDDITNFMGQ